MDILSASTYPLPSGSFAKKADLNRKQARGQVTVLGFIQERESTQQDEPTRGGEPSRKRRKKRAKDDEEELIKKQRGRPRLDTLDETAADRRRTQIRLAQRAYRMRKETTISALKKKIAQLEDTIEQMNQSFVHFSDNAMESGVLNGSPELAQQLRATTKQFLQLAKTVSSDSDHEEDAIEEITREKDGHSLEESPRRSTWLPSEGPQSDENRFFSKATPDQSETAVSQDTFLGHGSLPRTANSPDLMRYQQWNLELPEAVSPPEDKSAIERPLRLPSTRYTYNFQETTFARRLHRAALERGFRLLTDPSVDETQIEHSFRFNFCFTNRKRMTIRFQELLQRKATDSLENWTVPFFHVGGAGMHYPRTGKDGKLSYPPNIHSPSKALGPTHFTAPETTRDEQTTEQLLQTIGFGGTWFDSHDVESYLREKGISLGAQTSFVDVNSSVLPPSSLTLDSSPQDPSSMPPSRGSQDQSPWTSQLDSVPHLMQMSFNDDGLLPHGPILETTASPALLDKSEEELSYWSPPDGTDSSAAVDSWQQKVDQISGQLITIDVDKFLEGVTSKSVCLGRAPGFRQSDVDAALRAAVQEIY